MSGSKNEFHDIIGVLNAGNERVGRVHNNEIFLPIGGKPVAIIKGSKILSTATDKVVGS